MRRLRTRPALTATRPSALSRRGMVWLMAALALLTLMGLELGAQATRALAEQQTIAIVTSQMQADYAAQGALVLARACLARGRNPDRLAGACGQARYRLRARHEGRGWRVLAEGFASGPVGYAAQVRIEALLTAAGDVRACRYVRPLEPTPAGRT